MMDSRDRSVFFGVVNFLGAALLPLLFCSGCTRTAMHDFAPKSGVAGDKVRIEASLCSADWLEGVWFNDVKSADAVIAKGRRAIVASVPEGASTGRIRVRIDTGIVMGSERHVEYILSEDFFVGEAPGDMPPAVRPRIMSFTATANTVLKGETLYAILKGESLELKWSTWPAQLDELTLIGPGVDTSVLGRTSMTVSPPVGAHTYKLIAWKDGFGVGVMLTVRVRE